MKGYRGSYLTAYGNGDYGVYAFDSQWGRVRALVRVGPAPIPASTSASASPCHAVIDRRRRRAQRARLLGHERRRRPLDHQQRVGRQQRPASSRTRSMSRSWRPQRARRDRRQLRSTTTRRRRAGQALPVPGLRDRDPHRRRVATTWSSGNLVEDHAVYGIAVLPNLDANLWLTRATWSATTTSGARAGRTWCSAGRRSRATASPATSFATACRRRSRHRRRATPRIGRWRRPRCRRSRSLARFVAGARRPLHRGDWRTAAGARRRRPRCPTRANAPAVTWPSRRSAVPGPHGPSDRSTDPRLGATPVADAPKEVHDHGDPARRRSARRLSSGCTRTSAARPVRGLDRDRALGSRPAGGRLGPAPDRLDGRRPRSSRSSGPLAYFAAGGSPISRAVRWFLVLGGLPIYLGIASLAVLAEAL